MGEKAFIRESRDASSEARRYALPMGIQVEEYGELRQGAHGRHGARGRRKIEGTRLNVGQRRKLRRKACSVAMDSIRPEDVESPSSNVPFQLTRMGV